MRARKAYISSLGTTGVLIAAALVMLTIVGALVAFDRWPTHAIAEAETVPIARDSTDAIGRAAVAHAARPTSALRLDAYRVRAIRGVARRAGGVDQRAGAALAPGSRAADPVISDLPAPDTATAPPAGSSAPATPASSSNGPAPTPGAPDRPPLPLPSGNLAPTAGDGVAQLTGTLGDTVTSVSPSLGQTVRGTGATVNAATREALGGGLAY
jgi:hypothetical protein